MDTSNPVMSADRHTVSEVLERSRRRRRQNLDYIAERARTSRREGLPVASPILPVTEVRQIVSEFKATQPKVDATKNGDLPGSIFEVVHESIPICGLKDSTGMPLHPPHLNNNQGRVQVTRVMGGVPNPPFNLADIVGVAGEAVLDRDKVYTGGTWEGFLKRLSEQMGRKTVPLRKTMSVGKQELSWGYALDQLDKYMPRKPNMDWPGVHTSLWEGITERIKVTANSSAGAPYWRLKGECMDQILDVGLAVVLKHIKEGTLDKLFREQPEMFVVEVKNKLDRYSISDLKKKTRPYVATPAHWAFLFSLLTQGFQETLEVFDQPGVSEDCSNAYGFSSAKGGLKRFIEKCQKTTKRGRVFCYGDDARIAVLRDGQVYIVDPDFKQMDGSLDRDDIQLTIKWVLRHLRRDLGVDETPAFWKSIANMWLQMATQPLMMVDGTRVYRKKSPNGLMTGIPGTTLFDTVKSVLAWNTYLDYCDMNGLDCLDGNIAIPWMQKNGLVVKEGTWNPTPLPEMKDGVLMTDHKFLGVQVRCVSWRGELICVPTIPENEALEMCVVQKDNPFLPDRSRTSCARTVVDRNRGLFTTFGFGIPLIRDIIHNSMNNLPPVAILMEVQSGQGDRPDSILLQGEEKIYPDSSGFPSMEWCYDLYSDREREDREGWISLFPDLQEELEELKGEERGAGKQLRAILRDVQTWGKPAKSIKLEEFVQPEKDIDPVYEVADKIGPPCEPPEYDNVNPRSFIARVEDTDRIVPEKYMGTLGTLVRKYLASVGGVSQCGVVAERVGTTIHQLKLEAIKYAFYMTGDYPGDLISLYPVQTPFRTLQEDIVEINRDLPIGAKKKMAFEPKAPIVLTRPEMVHLDMAFVRSLPRDVKFLRGDLTGAQALEKLQPLLTYDGMTESVHWETLPVAPKRGENSVGVSLVAIRKIPVPIEEVTVQTIRGYRTETVLVARCWSVSSRMAKQYIAKTIMFLCGASVEEGKFSTSFIPPPPDYMESWSSQAEHDENPMRDPFPVDIDGGVSSITRMDEMVLELIKEFPDIEGSRIAASVALAQSHGKNALAVAKGWLQKIRDGPKRPDPPAPQSPPVLDPQKESKRSRLSPEKKNRLNRKVNLRRRRRDKENRELLRTSPKQI